MNNEFSIEKVEASRSDKLFALAKDIWSDHYPAVIGQAQTDYLLENFHSAKTIKEDIVQGRIIYYAVSERGEYKAYIGFYDEEDGVFVSKVYVHKNARKKGYARALLRHILTIKPQIKFIRLFVNRHNKGSIAAYERLGFMQIGEFTKEIGGGFFYDDYIMQMDKPQSILL